MKRQHLRSTGFQPSVFILLLSLITRAAWIARFPAVPSGPVDAEGYHLIAQNLLAGRGFAMTWGAPFCSTALRTPLYPLFLAGTYRLLGAAPARAVLFQLLLEVLTTALVIRMGKLLGGPRLGLLAGLLYALNGSTQRYTGVLFAETLLLPVMTAALWVSLAALQRPSPRQAALGGALWGLAILIKPNVQFLALAVGGLLLANDMWRYLRHGNRSAGAAVSRFRAHLAAVALFSMALGLTLSPWLIRNRMLFGRWILSTAFEENLARVSAIAVLAEVSGLRAEPWTPTWEMLYAGIVEDTARRYAWSAAPETTLPCAEREQRRREVAAVAWELARAHPAAWIGAHLRGVRTSLGDVGHRVWYPVLTGRGWENTGVLDDIWHRMGEALAIGAVGDALHALWLERIVRAPLDAALLWWGLLILRGLVWYGGLRGSWRLRHTPAVALLLAGTAAYGLLLAGPIAHDRFYLPAIPAVALLVALGQGQLLEKISDQ